MCKDILDSELLIPGYHLFRFDRNCHGGGVLAYVDNNISVSLDPTPPSPLELLSFSVNVGDTPLHMFLFYRSPSSHMCIFDLLCSYLYTIDAIHFSNFVCLGDFSVNIDDVTHSLYFNLLNFCCLLCHKVLPVLLTYITTAPCQLLI